MGRLGPRVVHIVRVTYVQLHLYVDRCNSLILRSECVLHEHRADVRAKSEEEKHRSGLCVVCVLLFTIISRHFYPLTSSTHCIQLASVLILRPRSYAICGRKLRDKTVRKTGII